MQSMMEPQNGVGQKKSAITVTYSKPGTQPPIYLAGSFCNWQPQEMEHTADGQGEYKFTKEIEVEEGKEYQYKFRVGEGDWWLLNEDEPIVTDDVGNRNNLLAVPVLEGPKMAVTEDIKDSSEATVSEAERTVGQVDGAHMLRSPDTELDYVVVKSGAHTPDIANNAAEVADSAMILDRDVPTPPMSDEEAGRTGYRRMSQTPIPQVAETAAEVADSAAILDKDNMPKLDLPPIPATFEIDQPDTPDSGAATPPEDKVPLFAHECIKPPPEGFETGVPPPPEPIHSEQPVQEPPIDYDDPLLEEFPSERGAILERVRTSQSRLAEDQTTVDGIPPSPVVGAKPHPDRMELPSPSLGLLSQERSPSLDSIPEDGEEGNKEEMLSLPEGTNTHFSGGEPHTSQSNIEEDVPNLDTRKFSVDVQEVPESPPSNHPETTLTNMTEDNPTMDGAYVEPEPMKLPSTPFVQGEIDEQESNVKEIVAPEEGPHITVQPATPGSSLKTADTDPFIKPVEVDTAKATAIEEENGRSQLTSRKPTGPSPERPLTPSSVRSAGKDAKSRNFLKAFWQVVFVEWIGQFIMRLCGGDHQKALLAITVLLLITIAPAVYFSI